VVPQKRRSSFTANAQLEKLEKKIICRCEEIFDNCVAILSRHEDCNDDDHFPQSSQARDHFLVGCLWRLLADPQLERSRPLLFPPRLRPLRDAHCRQVFWVGRVIDLGETFIPGRPRRGWLTAIASVVWLFFFAYNIGPWYIPRGDSTHLTLRHVVFEAPFWWWFVGSWAGFALVVVFWTLDRARRTAAWVYRKGRKAVAGHAAAPIPAIALDPPSPPPPLSAPRTAFLA
jgi:hypothetical protein